TVTFFERGYHEAIERRVVIEDALGLSRLAIRVQKPCSIEARPHMGALRQLPLLTSYAGGDEFPHPMGLEDGDRVELRRYVPGDPARFIHWRIFSRTRRLMVRVPERALSQARRTVAYLVSGPGDEASAGAARAAVIYGGLGPEWKFSADGSEVDAFRAEDAI